MIAPQNRLNVRQPATKIVPNVTSHIIVIVNATSVATSDLKFWMPKPKQNKKGNRTKMFKFFKTIWKLLKLMVVCIILWYAFQIFQTLSNNPLAKALSVPQVPQISLPTFDATQSVIYCDRDPQNSNCAKPKVIYCDRDPQNSNCR